MSQPGTFWQKYGTLAQMAHQCAGVDVSEDRYFELLQVFFSDLLRAPVGAHARKLADDQALNVGARSFIVFGVGAVVADFRIGENDDLAGVGRIGKDFLIAGDGSIKNYFSVTFAFGSVAFASRLLLSSRARIACIDSWEWILLILSGQFISEQEKY
jgi:hypothetical protein